MTQADEYQGTSSDDLMRDLRADEYLSGLYEDTIERQAVLADLRHVREHLKLRQVDVAESMRVTQSTISELEGEGDDVYLSTVQRYARALEKRIAIVVVGPDEKVQVLPTDAASYEGYPKLVVSSPKQEVPKPRVTSPGDLSLTVLVS